MLSSLLGIQHVLIKREGLGLSRERSGCACPLGFAEQFRVLLVSFLPEHRSSICWGCWEAGPEWVLSKHLSPVAGTRPWQENWEGSHWVRQFTLSQGRLWSFLKERGRATKLKPCFHLMCFVCLPPVAFVERETPANDTRPGACK